MEKFFSGCLMEKKNEETVYRLFLQKQGIISKGKCFFFSCSLGKKRIFLIRLNPDMLGKRYSTTVVNMCNNLMPCELRGQTVATIVRKNCHSHGTDSSVMSGFRQGFLYCTVGTVDVGCCVQPIENLINL